jgi:hypothetical protein
MGGCGVNDRDNTIREELITVASGDRLDTNNQASRCVYPKAERHIIWREPGGIVAT